MITRFGSGACTCCGEIAWFGPMEPRCNRHKDRNPCAIEGCKRTRAAKGHFRNDQWLCSERWRRYVPPGSPMRRAYHRFFRLAKRHGWTDDLRRRFWRFWDALVKRVRRQATDGRLDETEINKMFGWSE